MLGWVTTFEGLVSGALLEASLFQKLSAFMIIQTFFVSALSGSILAEISALLEDPRAIFDLLAKSLPAQSTFFIQVSHARGLTLLIFNKIFLILPNPVCVSTLLDELCNDGDDFCCRRASDCPHCALASSKMHWSASNTKGT